MIQITNSLTRRKEKFEPWIPGKVRLYVCGPTVYNLIHIGNARPIVFFDVVRRYLKLSGYEVTFVSNFTDVEDKIIQRAYEEKTSASIISERYIQEFEKDVASLGVSKPDMAPKVTHHIPDILALIERLIQRGVAYVVNGEVFFSVRKFPQYGKLSGKKIDELLVGARVEKDEKKQDPLDFSLWKPQKTPEEQAWDSPWGKGRPGWHIECSAMSMRYLGESFDIHGGGMDLLHPHHENEIAQSEGATGKPFVKYWMHNNLLTFQTEKMSKSVGNIILARDFITTYGAETLKFLLLSGHYRSPIDCSEKHILESQTALHRVYSTVKKCETLAQQDLAQKPGDAEEKLLLEWGKKFETEWRLALDDDFNTARAFGALFEYVRALNGYLDHKGLQLSSMTREIAKEFLVRLSTFGSILNIFSERGSEFLNQLRSRILRSRGVEESKVKEMLDQRNRARAQKDFTTADAIRADLLKWGIELRDHSSGTNWDVI